MLTPPEISEQRLAECLRAEYGLRASALTFLPIGADLNTAVFRADAEDQSAWFLKLRKGHFEEITVAIPQFLSAQGIQAIISPVPTLSGHLWASLDPYRMILYPFIEGRNGYEVALSESQWQEFGSTLRRIHSITLPAALGQLVPTETYSAKWRQQVRAFQAQVKQVAFTDPTAARLAGLMKAQKEVIDCLVDRAGSLGETLASRPVEMVLCHSDIHPGNLFITASGKIYIVDWDNPVLAPKEHDLALVGGCYTWRDPHQVERFYQGYGPAPVDRMALAYYRCERAVQDIAAFCQQLLGSSEGGPDREQALAYCASSLLPGHEIELALESGWG